MNNNTLVKAIECINNASTVSLLPHISADGDSVGAAFALKLALEQLNKTAIIYLEEDVQKRYLFAVRDIDYRTINNADEAAQVESDLAIALDCSNKDRLGNRVSILNNSKKTICIDHHISSSPMTQLDYRDINWASCTIGAYYLIKELEITVTDKIAELIYIGLATDTGGFRYSNTNPEAHMVAAELLAYNVNTQMISINVFDNVTYGRYMLNGEAVKRAEFFFDGKVCICYIPKSVYEKYKATEEDSEGIVDYLRNVEGTEVIIYVKDRQEHLKMSMRSKYYVNVFAIAQKFSGGGHERAAGADWNGDYDSLKEELLKELESIFLE